MECDKCTKKFTDQKKFNRHHTKCKNKICANCKAVFSSAARLKNHIKNRTNISCEQCERKFCTKFHLLRHLRTTHEDRSLHIPNLNLEIYPSTLYEKENEYQDVIKENRNVISDSQDIKRAYAVYNKQIDSTFTYNDLQNLILNVYTQKSPLKINIAFGYIIHNPTSGEYRYHYPSDNNQIFERAITINWRRDVTKLMNRIIALDLPTTYFLMRPSTSWILTGLTNVQIKVIYLIRKKEIK